MEPKFHHVGYATKSIKKSIEIFHLFGYKTENSMIIDERLGVKIQFLAHSNIESPRIELVEDLINGDIHPLRAILKQRPGSYHLAYLVDSVQEFSRENKLRAITRCSPARAFDGRHVQFFISRDEGIIELISNALECTCAFNG